MTTFYLVRHGEPDWQLKEDHKLQTVATINRTLGLPLWVEFDLHEWTPDSFQAASIDEIRELQRDYVNLNGIHPPGETRLWEPRANVRAGLKRCSSVIWTDRK